MAIYQLFNFPSANFPSVSLPVQPEVHLHQFISLCVLTRVSTKQSILLCNSFMVLHEMTFLLEIPHHLCINTKPVLQEIAHSFEINNFFARNFCMNAKLKSEFVHDIRIYTGYFCNIIISGRTDSENI